jgi:hypothetical protein
MTAAQRPDVVPEGHPWALYAFSTSMEITELWQGGLLGYLIETAGGRKIANARVRAMGGVVEQTTLVHESAVCWIWVVPKPQGFGVLIALKHTPQDYKQALWDGQDPPPAPGSDVQVSTTGRQAHVLGYVILPDADGAARLNLLTTTRDVTTWEAIRRRMDRRLSLVARGEEVPLDQPRLCVSIILAREVS